LVLSTATNAKVGVLNATPGACGSLTAPTTVGWLHFRPQFVDFTMLIDVTPVLRSKAL
jgi:hypothetical protein